MPRPARALLLLPLVACTTDPAGASSPAAWERFRAEVRAACAPLAPEGARLEVDPFGTAHYGLAFVRDAQDRVVQVCVFDKTAKRAEITAEFGGDLPGDRP